MVSILRNASLLPCFGSSIAFPETLRSLSSLRIKQRAAATPLQIKPFTYFVKPLRFTSFITSTAFEEAAKTAEAEETEVQEDSEEEPSLVNGSSDDNVSVNEEKFPSAVMASLQSYQEALANDNLAKIAEIEASLLSIEDEKNSLTNKVTALSGELLIEKDRILRISADFVNFRKRTERERLSLMENVQGEIIESLLPVLESFEIAKAQIKPETDGEEKINNSYQSIYKQFFEILTSLGVKSIETLGNPFDPMLHEAIMREDSAEFEEGTIIQEFRKGFKLGERLLRPSMVKVSAGPGPAKLQEDSRIPADEDSKEEEVDTESAEEGRDPILK